VLLTPVPARETLFGELLALLVIATLPFTLPVAIGANITFNSAVCPAAIVVPATPLPTLKPVPLTLIVETVTLEFPAFFTATSSVLVPPTISFPKFRLAAESEIVRVSLTPVPLSASISVEFVAVLLNVRLPVTLPVIVGANPTAKLVVCPASSVSEGELASPFNVNPVPSKESLDSVSADPPVFFSCTVCEFLLPTATDPKLTLLGVAVKVPGVTPVPLTEYSTLLFVALLLIAM